MNYILMLINNINDSMIVFVGATLKADHLNTEFLRKFKIFNMEFFIKPPNQTGRIQILRILTKDLKLSMDFDFKLVPIKNFS